jgi:carbon storage regulator
MLVLSRKAGESILIGDDIRIKVLEIKNGRLKLGLEAPDEVCIVRGELVERDLLSSIVSMALEGAAECQKAA